MNYQYVVKKENYECLSSGRVLHSMPGQSAFPIRLSSEIIQRCFALLEARGNKGPYTIYDCCCGGGYLLTTLGFIHNDRLKKIYASDIDPQSITLAKKNLALLSPEGLNQRTTELEALAAAYHKSSHREAVEDAKKLRAMISHNIETECFQADITSKDALPITKVDIVITDLPYGKLANWKSEERDPVLAFFNKISQVMTPLHTILTVISNKDQNIQPKNLTKIGGFKVGHRQVKLFSLPQQ